MIEFIPGFQSYRDDQFQQTRFACDLNQMNRLGRKYIRYTRDQFTKDVPNILHWACFASYILQLPPHLTVYDLGLIHELTHIMTIFSPRPMDDANLIAMRLKSRNASIARCKKIIKTHIIDQCVDESYYVKTYFPEKLPK